MIFTFAAMATRVEGDLTPLKGMKRLADVLHPHGVAITWLVSPETAGLHAAELTEWHEQFGDDVAISPEGLKRDHTGVDLGAMQGDIPAQAEAMGRTRDSVREILPWTRADVAHGPHQDHVAIQALEQAGFSGLWGFCWEQIEIDGITDRGIPWGFYYLDPRSRTAPNTLDGGLIGMEWTSRDLCKSHHSGNPTIWSSDVNDVGRAGLCRWRDCDYLKGQFNQYYRNRLWNDLVVYQVHQEAHEMMPEFKCYSEEDCVETMEMLDEYIGHVMSHRDVRSMTLSDAAQEYRRRNDRTAPSYIVWEDLPVPEYNDDFARGVPRGPWPKTFLYYDDECQMMFVDGGFEPITIRNYALRDRDTGNPVQPYYGEFIMPRVRLTSHERSPYGMTLKFEIESPKAMPMGVTFWEDFGPYLYNSGEGILDHKIISGELLFLRMNVAQGKQEYTVRFNRK
jgi:hypothetical protein